MTYYTKISYNMYVSLMQDSNQASIIREKTAEEVTISYDGLIELLDKAKWKWEHIGKDGNTIRVYNRFYGNDFTFKENKNEKN